MKVILTVIVLALTTALWAQDSALMQDAITQPSQSLRCKELFKERDEKIKVQQRLNALLERNQLLVKKAPASKQSLRSRILSNQVKVKNEVYLANLQVEAMEENIVRSGCPGLSLQ